VNDSHFLAAALRTLAVVIAPSIPILPRCLTAEAAPRIDPPEVDGCNSGDRKVPDTSWRDAGQLRPTGLCGPPDLIQIVGQTLVEQGEMRTTIRVAIACLAIGAVPTVAANPARPSDTVRSYYRAIQEGRAADAFALLTTEAQVECSWKDRASAALGSKGAAPRELGRRRLGTPPPGSPIGPQHSLRPQVGQQDDAPGQP